MLHPILNHPVLVLIVVGVVLVLIGVVLASRRDAAEYEKHRDQQKRWRS
jgi:uncharacterized membrane protein